jgi:3-hydroxyisobutyrate dehydrogenase
LSRAEEFARDGRATSAGTPGEAVRDADVVITCLSNSPDVASLVDGPDGLLTSMRPGSVLVDCTSGEPATSRRIAAQLAERGIDFLDAPVSGGVGGAERGALTIMVGGKADVLERVRPVLATFGQKIVHCGELARGTR